MLATTFRFVSGFIVAFVRRCLPFFYSIVEEAYIFATQRPVSADQLMSPDLKDSLEFILECPICYSEYDSSFCKRCYQKIFHKSYLSTFQRGCCPICRKNSLAFNPIIPFQLVEAVRVCKLQYEYIKVLNVVELDKSGRNEGQYEIKTNSPKTKQSNLIN